MYDIVWDTTTMTVIISGSTGRLAAAHAQHILLSNATYLVYSCNVTLLYCFIPGNFGPFLLVHLSWNADTMSLFFEMG